MKTESEMGFTVLYNLSGQHSRPNNIKAKSSTTFYTCTCI